MSDNLEEPRRQQRIGPTALDTCRSTEHPREAGSGHQAIVHELRQFSQLDVEGVDLSIPYGMEVSIAARQRQVLRNSAVLAQLNQRLARRRNATDEARRLGQELDRYVRDIAEIDRLYPEARANMEELDAPISDSYPDSASGRESDLSRFRPDSVPRIPRRENPEAGDSGREPAS